MITLFAMLLLVLIGVALAIFGVVAVLAGMLWLLWPVIIVALILIGAGYYLGKKKGGNERRELPGE